MTPSTPPQLPAPESGWTRLDDPPLSARYRSTAVWTDDMLIVFGGTDRKYCGPAAECFVPDRLPKQDGARWDPRTGGWSPIAPPPVPIGFALSAVVDGMVYVLAAPTTSEPGVRPTFVAYDPDADRWTELPLPDEHGSGFGRLVAGAGEVLLVQATHEHGDYADLRFDPATRSWTALPADPLRPSFDRDLTLVGDLLVLTGIDVTPSPGGDDGPARYRAATWTDDRGWQELSSSEVIGWDPEWLAVGSQLINPATGSSDGGATNSYERAYPVCGILDPATGAWSDLPSAPTRAGSSSLVTGNVGDEELLVTSTGWALQPATGRWHELGTPPEGPDELAAIAVGNGHLFAIGGIKWRQADVQNAPLNSAWVWTPPTPP